MKFSTFFVTQLRTSDLVSAAASGKSNVCLMLPDKWVCVCTSSNVLKLEMDEQPPIWRVAANILSKLSQTVDKRYS